MVVLQNETRCTVSRVKYTCFLFLKQTNKQNPLMNTKLVTFILELLKQVMLIKVGDITVVAVRLILVLASKSA